MLMTKESKIPNFFMIYGVRCQMIVQYKNYHLVVPAREQANLPVFNNNEKMLYVSKRERERKNVCVYVCERVRECACICSLETFRSSRIDRSNSRKNRVPKLEEIILEKSNRIHVYRLTKENSIYAYTHTRADQFDIF